MRFRTGSKLFAVVALAASFGGTSVAVAQDQGMPQPPEMAQAAQAPPTILGTRPLYGLEGATGWINSPPLTAKELKGKVVLIDFWDYSCINCIRSIPYVRAWADRYKKDGLVVIGVHTPEFDIEKQKANVEAAVKRFGITYPVALDSDYKIWDAFSNQYWPADYLIDGKGTVRYEYFGEGDYLQTEHWIYKLLKEAHVQDLPTTAVEVDARGAEAPADAADERSPETYIGYAHDGEHFASPGGLKHDKEREYAAPKELRLNEWGLVGAWDDHKQFAVPQAAGAKIVFRFHARDLHLVMAPGDDGKPVRFKVLLDGQAPGANHGSDVDADGNGVVNADALYQLIRLDGPVKDHTFTIEFEDAGGKAFSFTFG